MNVFTLSKNKSKQSRSSINLIDPFLAPSTQKQNAKAQINFLKSDEKNEKIELN